MKHRPIFVHDNATVKWMHNGISYCMHIWSDEWADSPREWDNLTTMACWHRDYRLGDNVEEKTPEQFWQKLVRQHCSDEEIFEAVRDGRLEGIRLEKNQDDPETYDIYETCYLAGFQTSNEAKEYLEYSEIGERAVADYIVDDLEISHCMALMEPYAVWLPLWLYDHSGLTISCGNRNGVYADRWDSGQVGWILAFKDKIMSEAVEIVEDVIEKQTLSNGVTVETRMTRPLTEETWKNRAFSLMKSDVEQYDQYLRGESYVCTIYQAAEDDWDEIDCCGGFLGDDLVENGMLDEAAGFGLKEAIERNEYEIGEAKERKVVTFSF